MSPKFNGKGSQKFSARPAQGARGKFGPVGKQTFKGKQQPAFHKKSRDDDSEDFSNESFDDSDASDLNDTPDEGIDERFSAKKSGQKRSLSFADDVKTASGKKGVAQKTPLPSKQNGVNGKPQSNNTPLGKKSSPAIDAKKPGKGKAIPSEEEDDEDEFGSEVDSEDFDDEMGSEEEEDSLMDIDEETEEDEEASDASGSDEDLQPKKKQDAKQAQNKPAGTQLKVCGIPKSVAPEKLASFFSSKGFKDVHVEYLASAGCFLADVKSAADAAKMKTALKGAEFNKNKLSLLDYTPKQNAPAQPAAKKAEQKSNKKVEELSEEDMSDDDVEGSDEEDDMESFDDEDMSDEEMDEMESYDEEDSEEADSDEETMKKANAVAKSKAEAMKAKAATNKTTEKKTADEKADKKPTLGGSELKAVIRGVAKTYDGAKVKSFLEEKGITIKGSVAWDGPNGGFTAAVPSTADMDKLLALRGSKMEKFSLSVQPLGAAASAKKPEPQQNKQDKAPTNAAQNLQVSLKGVPKTTDSSKIAEFLKSKKINIAGKIEWAQDAAGFVVTLKSKADLDAIKSLKGEKIADKFRFTVTDYAGKAGKAEPTKEVKKNDCKITKKQDDESASEEASDEEDSLNLGESDDEDLSGSEDEEEDEDEQPKPKQAKKEQPKEAVAKSAPKGDGKEATLRLAGLPKSTPLEKLQDFLKQRGLASAVVKLQDNTLTATVNSTGEADKLRAMSGVRFNAFVMTVEDFKPGQAKKADNESVPSGQLQFRARLLSIPSDFAVPKLTNLLKSRGVQSVVVTKENGQYVANCQNKLDFNKLLALKGQRIDDKVRLMVAPMHANDQKQQQQPQQQSQDSRKRPADENVKPVDGNAGPNEAKKPRQQEDSTQQRRQLYVGNIPPQATDDEIRKCFNESVGVKVIRRQGAKKLFAFVSFDSEQSCELVKKAKESSGGVKIRGEKLTIDFCGDKSSKFKEIQAAKQPEQKVEQQPKKDGKSVEKPSTENQQAGKKKPEEKKAAAKPETAPKGQLKSAQSPSKDARVRFVDDVAEEDDGDDDSEEGSFDEDDFDEEGSDEDMSFDDDDEDDDDDDDEEEDDE